MLFDFNFVNQTYGEMIRGYYIKGVLLFCALFSAGLLLAKSNDSLDIKFAHLSTDKIVDTLNIIAKNAYRKQEFNKAELYFKKAMQYANRSNDKAAKAKINNNIGIIQDTKGNFAKALEYYKDALVFYEQQSNIDGIEKVLNNIGIVYEEMEMYSKALKYYKKSLKLKNENPNKNFVSIAGTYNNIAILYENYLHNSDSALIYYQLAHENYQLANYKNGVANVCSNVGVLYFRKNDLKKADSCYQLALSVFKSTNNKNGIASVMFYKANLAIKKNQPEEAIKLLNKAMVMCHELRTKKLEKDINKAYATAYENLGNNDSALFYYKKYVTLKDEIFTTQKLSKIKGLQREIEINSKDYEISLLKKEQEINKLKQNRQFIIIFTLLILTLILFISFYQISRRRRMKNEMELSKAKTRLLRAQMSPHFIFNSLMSIQTFLIEGDVKGASKYLTLLARLMRLLLAYSRESYISLEQEIEVIKYYLQTEKLRFGDKINYIIEIDPDVNRSAVLIPPLMIQPALENAIIHGLMPCKKKGMLKIRFNFAEEMLVAIIEDNGIGYKSAKKSSGFNKKSFSTAIIKERIQLIEKQFKQKIGYQIEEINPGDENCAGTRVIFKFPFN